MFVGICYFMDVRCRKFVLAVFYICSFGEEKEYKLGSMLLIDILVL